MALPDVNVHAGCSRALQTAATSKLEKFPATARSSTAARLAIAQHSSSLSHLVYSGSKSLCAPSPWGAAVDKTTLLQNEPAPQNLRHCLPRNAATNQTGSRRLLRPCCPASLPALMASCMI